MNQKQLMFMLILIFFGTCMGVLIHEAYHAWDASRRGYNVDCVYILGWHEKASHGFGGGVHHDGDEHLDEIVPYILSIITTLWCVLGLLNFFGERKNEK